MLFCKRGANKVVLLSNDEVATAIRSYLVARNVSIMGPNTVRLETPDAETHEIAVIVDPSGRLIDDEGREVK